MYEENDPPVGAESVPEPVDKLESNAVPSMSGEQDQATNPFGLTQEKLESLSDQEAEKMISEMFNEHRNRLLRMIEVRLPVELRSRVDAEDVLQESFIEALRQLRSHVSFPKYSAIVWLRLIVGQQLVAFYRRYCQTQKRNVMREHSLVNQCSQADPGATSLFLVGNLTSPTVAARRNELIEKTRACLEKLAPNDREILSLRHYEQLSNKEAAEELHIAPSAASVLYCRALKKFTAILQEAKLNELL